MSGGDLRAESSFFRCFVCVCESNSSILLERQAAIGRAQALDGSDLNVFPRRKSGPTSARRRLPSSALPQLTASGPFNISRIIINCETGSRISSSNSRSRARSGADKQVKLVNWVEPSPRFIGGRALTICALICISNTPERDQCREGDQGKAKN